MVIYGVSFDMVGKSPIVLLKTADGNRFLPIWIGHNEAAAILMKLQGQAAPRPMTHDLLNDVLAQLDAHVARVTVTELRESIYYAAIHMVRGGESHEISSRPSDAIAIAVRMEVPIFASEDVLAEASILIPGDEEEEVEKFREFLDNVRPEDFES